jgi:[protein-PII] uridylyltransferase
VTAAERGERTAAADRVCAGALETALGGLPEDGVALVAVGGYGRRELAPYSDLDVVLVHADAVDVASVATDVWYPLWDAAASLDHSVRALSDVTRAAASDMRVALGLLDARHVAGDPTVTLRLRADLLSRWRRDARANLPALRDLVERRGRRLGELAHASVPDLKESTGGLRDATVLTALVATWLVDVPHADLERCRRQLLDVRDVLQAAAGRATDRVVPELWQPLADGLRLPDAEAAQRQVRELGRRITHISRLTWHRVGALLDQTTSPTRPRRPSLEPVAPGVAVSAKEVVLDRGTDPARDPLLLLRAAAEAAERRLVLSPATAARLHRQSPPLPAPWSADARNLFVRLLASGPGLLAVWETLDETGCLSAVLPEWERVRLLPHASVMHRFTVDRHLVETCIEASRLIRRVARPDLLMVAAILHDIGKGGRLDHSVAGAPVAAEAARRMGFPPHDVEVVHDLVRWHLLLAEVSTTRDLGDPATIAYVAERLRPGTVDLLAALTEADARATAHAAWTTWRAGLVTDLVRRTNTVLTGERPEPEADAEDVPVPGSVRADPSLVELTTERLEDGTRVTVVTGDRVGLMAAVAGAFTVLRASVRSARAWTQDDVAVSVWELDDPRIDPAILRQRVEAVLAGQLDPARRLRPPAPDALEPSVLVRHEASRHAAVLEVRMEDRPGVLYLVCRALAGLDLSVRSAHVNTLGPQTLDVFYVQETGAGLPADPRAASAVHAVRRVLTAAATLDD